MNDYDYYDENITTHNFTSLLRLICLLVHMYNAVHLYIYLCICTYKFMLNGKL